MSRVRLADYFAVVGFNFEKKRTAGDELCGEGKTLERFPSIDWPEISFPEKALALFCQPNGWRLRTKAEVARLPPTVCMTVFTDEVGGRAYGVFLSFYEPVDREQFLRPFFETESTDPNGKRLSLRTSDLYAPKTLAVLGRLPVLDCLKTSLCILYTAFIERKCELLELLVGNMLRWQAAEPDNSIRFKMGFGDIQPVQIPQCAAIPFSSDYTVGLFEHLGIKNVLTLIVALLCGERVLLISRAHSRLFGAAQALVSLLYPFEYAYTLLPLVPAQLVPNLVDNPTPFLYGVHESLIPLIPDPEESFRTLVVVNLDTCAITLPERSDDSDGSSSVPAIPDALHAKLTDALIRILQPDLALADYALPASGGTNSNGSATGGEDLVRQPSESVSSDSGWPRGSSISNSQSHAAFAEERKSRPLIKQRAGTSLSGSPQHSITLSPSALRSRTFLDKRIRAAFVRFFAELLIGYRSALIVVRVLPEPLITFDRIAFLAARKRLGCKFFEALLNSCLFQLFIQKRGRPFRPRDLFDDTYTTILDRLKLDYAAAIGGLPVSRVGASSGDDLGGSASASASSPTSVDLETVPGDTVSMEHVDAIAERLHRNEFGNSPGAQQLIRRIPEFTRNFAHASRFPPLTPTKIESMIADSSARSRANANAELDQDKPQVIEIGPNPEEYSGSAVLDRHEQRANVESRLTVLQRCIDYIFDRQISDALKVFPAVLATLQTPRGRLALVRKLQAKVEEKARTGDQKTISNSNAVKGKVDDAQFDLISRLLNVALRADPAATDEYSVAYRMMPVARAIFKPLGASHCQLFVCKQIQDYPVWRCAQYWETALYKDIEANLHSDYLKRARTDPRFSTFLSETKAIRASGVAGASDERRGEVLKLFTELHRWRDAVLRLTAQAIRQRSAFSEEELKQLNKDEEMLIGVHINAYIDTILDYLVPVRIADAVVAERDAERRHNAAARTVSGQSHRAADESLHDIEVDLLLDDPTARAVQIRAVHFIKQFIDHAHQTLCRGDRSVRDNPNPYRSMVDARVRAHIDMMLETREAIDRLPTVQPTRVVKPVLLVGEYIVTELRCYLLADARDAPLFDGDYVPAPLTAAFLERSNGARSCAVSDFYDAEAGIGGSGAKESEVQLDVVARIEERRPPVGDQSRPATAFMPAAGALFLTNYRVVFKGSPCEQIAACHTVSRSFAVGSLMSHKHAEPAAFGFAHAPNGCVHDALYLRSAHGAFAVRVAFDASVSGESVREFRDQLNYLRKAKCLLTVFAVTSNFADCHLVDIAKGGARSLGQSDSVASAKQRTLMQRARQKATKVVANPFKSKKTQIREVLVHRNPAADVTATHLDTTSLTFARGTPTYSSSVSVGSNNVRRRVLHPVDETNAPPDSDVEDENDTAEQRSVAESETRVVSTLTLPPNASEDNISTVVSVVDIDIDGALRTVNGNGGDRQLNVQASPSTSSSQMMPDSRSIVTTATNASAAVSLPPDGPNGAFDPALLLRAFNDEFSAYADYVRLGFTVQAAAAAPVPSSPANSLLGGSSATGSANAQPPNALALVKQTLACGAAGPLTRSLRLTLENARHTLCPSYPAVLIVPHVMSDEGLRKLAKTHSENRFPAVVWRHPRTMGLLLRGGSFIGKGFAAVFKQSNPGVTGREDFSAGGGSTTRDAEQERFLGALINSTFGAARRLHQPLIAVPPSPESFRRRAMPNTNVAAHDPYASNANFRKVKPRVGGETGTPTLATRGADLASTNASTAELAAANAARSIADRIANAKAYVLIDKDGRQPNRPEMLIQCEFIEVEHHDARELRDAYQRLMDACAPLGSPPNGNEDETFLSKVVESGWLKQVQTVLRIAGLVVELLDAQGASVALCLESGWEVTAQIVSITEILLDPFYRTLRGFAVLVEKEWAAFGHRFSHRHKQTTLDAAVAPFFLQFLDCVNQIREQFPSYFEFNEYFLRFVAYHTFSNRFVDFLYDSEVEREASGLNFARQAAEFHGAQASGLVDSGSNDTAATRSRSTAATGSGQRPAGGTARDDAKNASGPVYASQFVRFSSIWRYVDYYSRQAPIFTNCLYDSVRWSGAAFTDEAVLRPQTCMPRLTIWNYFTEVDMFDGASLYDPELRCVELLNSFSAHNATDDSVYLVPEDLERAFGLRSASEDELPASNIGGSPTDVMTQSTSASAAASTQKPPNIGTMKSAGSKDEPLTTSTVMIRSISRKPELNSTAAAAKQRIIVQLAYENGNAAVPSTFALLHLLTQWRTMMDRQAITEGDQSFVDAYETIRSTFLAEAASQVNKGRLLPLPRSTAFVAHSSGLHVPTTDEHAEPRIASIATMSSLSSVSVTSPIQPTWATWWTSLADRHRGVGQSNVAAVSNPLTLPIGEIDPAFVRGVSLRAHRSESVGLIVHAAHRMGAAAFKDNHAMRGRLLTELNQLLQSPRSARLGAQPTQNGAVSEAQRSMNNQQHHQQQQPAAAEVGKLREPPPPPVVATRPPRAIGPRETQTPPPVPPRPSHDTLTLGGIRNAFGTYLYKQGQVFRKWERHYFVLDGPKRVIWQFETFEEARQDRRGAEKWIDLNDMTAVFVLEQEAVRNPPRNTPRGAFFTLNSKFRNYSFLAEDANVAREWVNRLSPYCPPKPSS